MPSPYKKTCILSVVVRRPYLLANHKPQELVIQRKVAEAEPSASITRDVSSPPYRITLLYVSTYGPLEEDTCTNIKQFI